MTEQSKLEWTEYKSRFRAVTAYGTYWVDMHEGSTSYKLICGTNPCCVMFHSPQEAKDCAQMIHDRPSSRDDWFNLSDTEQAPYHAPLDLPELLRTYETLLAGDNLPERIAVQTVDLRALLNAAKHIDVAAWAQHLLSTWDQWYSCRQRDDEAKALSEKLILASCFAGIAYDAAMSIPIMEDKAPEFLLRIFLIALIDQNSPELDPYRAKNSPQAATQAADGTKPVDVADADGSITAEKIRLENLKQMAIYDGAIVSFECREPYYLASCDHCGWVGSSELCSTDSFGDDSDVYCPRCHSSGADCGEVAERINCQPVDLAAMLEVTCSINIHEEANSYEWRGEGSDYTSLPHEKAMLEDFGHSLISQIEDAARALSPAEPAQGDRWHDISLLGERELGRLIVIGAFDGKGRWCATVRRAQRFIDHHNENAGSLKKAMRLKWEPTHFMELTGPRGALSSGSVAENNQQPNCCTHCNGTHEVHRPDSEFLSPCPECAPSSEADK